MHSRREAVPPCCDAARDGSVVYNLARRVANLETGARLSGHRVAQRSVQGARNGRAGETALVHADCGRFSEAPAQRLGKVDAGRWQHPDAAAALCLRLDGVRSDQRNASDVGFLQRQQAPPVAQQDKGSRCDSGQQARVDQLWRSRSQASVEAADAARQGEDARDLVVDLGLGHGAVANRRDELVSPGPVGPRHHEVEPGQRARHGRRRGGPVGDHHAVEAPVGLENVVQKNRVRRHGWAVDRVVSRHHKQARRLLQRTLRTAAGTAPSARPRKFGRRRTADRSPSRWPRSASPWRRHPPAARRARRRQRSVR